VTSDLWDSDDHLLGTPDGVVDLKTGKTMPADPGYFITKSVAVAPAEHADCPRWKVFLDEATDGDKDLQGFLQREPSLLTVKRPGTLL